MLSGGEWRCGLGLVGYGRVSWIGVAVERLDGKGRDGVTRKRLDGMLRVL